MRTLAFPCFDLCCLIGSAILCGSGCTPSAEPLETGNEILTVDTVSPSVAVWQKTTVQPATVHGFFEARVFAKTSGYVSEIRADIGQRVTKDDVLAVIDVPEMVQQRAGKLAVVTQLVADEKRATAELAVAEARIQSFAAQVDQARAEVVRAEATSTATRAEFARVSDLVQQKAVADRLLDESRNTLEAAEAETVAGQAAVTSAIAQLELSQAMATAAQADLEVAQALTEVARRELDEMDELLKYTSIRAPLDGVVTRRNVDPGDLVSSAQNSAGLSDSPPLFVVTSLEKVRVRIPIPERDAPFVDAGDEAHIVLQALPGKELTGTVSRVTGALDPKTRTMLIEVDLPNADGELLPGMFGQATITLEPPRRRVSLPAGAVRYDEQGKSSVYVVNASQTIEVIEVRTGLDDGRQIEITSGLSSDQRVVGALLQRLQPGQQVRVN